MINRIYIAGFRGVREGFIEGLKQITILIGRNGAGKSSILEALYLASAYAVSRDDVRDIDKLDYVVKRRGGRGSWNGSRMLLWHMGGTENPIKIRINYKGKMFEFEVRDVPKFNDPVRLGLSDEEPVKAKSFLKGLLLIDGVLARQPELVETYAWPRLIAKRLDKLVVEMVREELEPEAEGLTYVPAPSGENYYYLALQTAKTAVRIDDLGDGVRAVLLGAMLVLAYNPTVLLVEEPELHMHPAGLYTYMKFLVKLAKDMGFQIIASTHSIELVHIAQALSQELGVELAVLYLEREDGVLKARSFSAEDVEALRKLGVDVRLLHKF